jgi:dTDP-4-dehydrorhamnose reductase
MSILSQSKPKILITGANGLLGQKLVEQLVEQGKFDVIATGRGPSRLSGEGFVYQTLDIEDQQNVELVFSALKPEVIIHGAAMTNVDECELNREACFRANVLATQYLVEGAKKYNSHFVFVSTDFIFSGEDGKNPYDEDAAPNPVNYYGQTKLEAEEIVKNSGLNWAIARTAIVFGIGYDLSRSNIILWVKASLEAGKEIQVVDDQIRTPTLAEDLATGCILIVDKRSTGVFNISGAELLTPYQMAIETAEFFGLNKSLIKQTDSTKFKQPAKRPMKTGFIIEKARKQLGFEPKSFQMGIGILAKQIILARS